MQFPKICRARSQQPHMVILDPITRAEGTEHVDPTAMVSSSESLICEDVSMGFC